MKFVGFKTSALWTNW